MYICVCNVVTENDIHDAVRDGVRNMRELMACTGCSTQCGRCARTASEVLAEARGQQRTQPELKLVATSRVA